MAADLRSLGLEKLTVQERLELIETLWDSLPDQLETRDIPEWHLVELSKRRANATANPADGRPWREVLDHLESQQ